jgi:two-component system chemotaxis response regulator CheY
MRFLIVDDFMTMRRVLRSLLHQIGFDDVDEAADGAAALESLCVEMVDVVITDIEMPTMNGFELLESIKKDARLKHLPVLMVAAEARRDEIVRAVHSGAAGYLVKPFSRETLEERLRQIVPDSFAAA